MAYGQRVEESKRRREAEDTQEKPKESVSSESEKNAPESTTEEKESGKTWGDSIFGSKD